MTGASRGSTASRATRKRRGPTAAGLFAGIGGIELGLHGAGFVPELLCELDADAGRVLGHWFPGVTIAPDVLGLKALPDVDVVAAGFPCQDLSQAGAKAGISGSKSGLITALFKLLGESRSVASPRWLLIENVPYMLSLDGGGAMGYLVRSLERLGFRWAYRTVDARSFGIPQRRPRVVLLASRTEDPRAVLFADDGGTCPSEDRLYEIDGQKLYGFYWTEGLRGVGWAEDAVPPIKGGSGLGIPSPPAVWDPQDGTIGTIDVRDAERLQGFARDWTLPAVVEGKSKPAVRWRLIGNAVCVPMARWIGSRLCQPGSPACTEGPFAKTGRWPKAACGSGGHRFAVSASMYPLATPFPGLRAFLHHPLKPLSERATAGYLDRARRCPYRLSRWFLDDVAKHLARVRDRVAVAVH